MRQTESELLSTYQADVFSLHLLFRKYPNDFDSLCNLLPGVIHLNRIGSLDMVYLDPKSRNELEVSLEEIKKEGMRVLSNAIEPTCLENLRRHFSTISFEQQQVISYFQQLRKLHDKSQDYQWYFSIKKYFEKDLTLSITTPLSTLGPAQKKIEQVLEDNAYIRQYMKLYTSLSKRELELISLIIQGVSTREIAERLFISVHTVNTHRKNIGNKLGIKSLPELIRFAHHFNLQPALL